jgi:hypothetical protein
MTTLPFDRRIAGLLATLLLAAGIAVGPGQLLSGDGVVAQTHAQTHAKRV